MIIDPYKEKRISFKLNLEGASKEEIDVSMLVDIGGVNIKVPMVVEDESVVGMLPKLKDVKVDLPEEIGMKIEVLAEGRKFVPFEKSFKVETEEQREGRLEEWRKEETEKVQNEYKEKEEEAKKIAEKMVEEREKAREEIERLTLRKELMEQVELEWSFKEAKARQIEQEFKAKKELGKRIAKGIKQKQLEEEKIEDKIEDKIIEEEVKEQMKEELDEKLEKHIEEEVIEENLKDTLMMKAEKKWKGKKVQKAALMDFLADMGLHKLSKEDKKDLMNNLGKVIVIRENKKSKFAEALMSEAHHNKKKKKVKYEEEKKEEKNKSKFASRLTGY